MATARPADVIGLHFFNPAPVMKLVEVVQRSDHAGDGRGHGARVVRAARQARRWSAPTGPGFIVNALLFPYLNDAVRMLEAPLRDRRRHRRRDEGRLRLPDGPVRAARRGRAGRGAGHPAGAVPGVPRARLRARAAAGAPGHGRVPGPQEPAAASGTTSVQPYRAGEPATKRPRGRASARQSIPVAGATRRSGAGARSSRGQADGEWVVRRITGSASTKPYRCPGCDQRDPARRPRTWWPGRRDVRVASRTGGTGTRPAGRRATGADRADPAQRADRGG